LPCENELSTMEDFGEILKPYFDAQENLDKAESSFAAQFNGAMAPPAKAHVKHEAPSGAAHVKVIFVFLPRERGHVRMDGCRGRVSSHKIKNPSPQG
jgi:hypothetical protein